MELTSTVGLSLTPYFHDLATGYLRTIELTLLGFAISVSVAVVMALGRMSSHRSFRFLAGAFIEFWRGTSVIVQLYWVFFALPLLPPHIRTAALITAIAVLGLNSASYAADAIRGAIEAVPLGQGDAARALGLSSRRRFWRIILPQALPMMLPPLANNAIEVMKATSVVGFITVADLTYVAGDVRSAVGQSPTIYTVILFMYFALALVLSGVFRLLEYVTPTRRIDRQSRLGGFVGHFQLDMPGGEVLPITASLAGDESMGRA